MKPTWNTCLKAGLTGFALYLAIYYWSKVAGFLGDFWSALSSLLIGAVIAYIVNIPMSAYERWFFPKSQKKFVQKLRRPLCMLAAFCSLFVIIVAIIWLVVPQLTACVQLIIRELPGFFERLVKRAEELKIFSPHTAEVAQSFDWKAGIGDLLEVITSGVGSVAGVAYKAVASVFSGVVTAFLSLIFSIYLLLGKDKLKSQCRRLAKRYLKTNLRDKIDYVAKIFHLCFRRYIVGQCTEALILGVLCMLGMWALGLPYPAMVGALVAFTALIPVVGAFVGGGIGAFMIMTVSPVQALVFIIFLVILQQLEGNIIYPKVVGSSLGLPALWVLAAVTVGGGLFGVPGMLLGVPTAAALYRIIREDVRKKEPAEETEPQEQQE